MQRGLERHASAADAHRRSHHGGSHERGTGSEQAPDRQPGVTPFASISAGGRRLS
jgi:hypothetical protein